MAALTDNRDTRRRTGDRQSRPIAANVKIYAGSIVARDADGNATPGATATTLLGLGRAAETVDNTGGAAGALQVPIDKGIFLFANSATDPVVAGDIGNDCYIVDDQTVSHTDTNQSVAGKVYDLDSTGVWVQFL